MEAVTVSNRAVNLSLPINQGGKRIFQSSNAGTNSCDTWLKLLLCVLVLLEEESFERKSWMPFYKRACGWICFPPIEQLIMMLAGDQPRGHYQVFNIPLNHQRFPYNKHIWCSSWWEEPGMLITHDSYISAALQAHLEPYLSITCLYYHLHIPSLSLHLSIFCTSALLSPNHFL